VRIIDKQNFLTCFENDAMVTKNPLLYKNCFIINVRSLGQDPARRTSVRFFNGLYIYTILMIDGNKTTTVTFAVIITDYYLNKFHNNNWGTKWCWPAEGKDKILITNIIFNKTI